MQRPYCTHCKIVWSKYEIDSIRICTTCKSPLAKASFYPISKILGGIGVILVSLFTIVFMQIPIVWIGGGIIGLALIRNGVKEWKSLRQLDQKAKSNQEGSSPKVNKKYMVVTCGECQTKINVKKGLGVTSIQCPECHGQYRVKS